MDAEDYDMAEASDCQENDDLSDEEEHEINLEEEENELTDGEEKESDSDVEDEQESNDCDEEDVQENDGEGGGEEEISKKKGLIECVNDYLESIFSTCEEYDEEIEEELTAMYILLWRILSGTVGVVGLIVVLVKYPQYLNTLHENQLWFSNIKEVEREISFRTEQGLYYSYYKQILQAPNWMEGVYELVQDNKTEHGRTINIIHRFNVLPEITLSALYKFITPKDPPILFYVESIFRLHGVYLATLFMTSWYLSSSCLGGVVTAILYVVHRVDVTRVNYTVPLRESFAVPLLFLQILLICAFLRSPKLSMCKKIAVFALTTSFLLSWQFGPFIVLCQLFTFVVLGRLHIICGDKETSLIILTGGSLLASCFIQANPPLVISSPALSMLVPALILSFTDAPSKSLGAIVRLFVTAAELGLMLIATMLINGSIKMFLNIDADSHIYQLLLAKLQMGDLRDFDSRLYVCNEAFSYLDMDTFKRLSESGLLPVYTFGIMVFVSSFVYVFFKINGDNLDADGTPPVEEEECDYQPRVEELDEQKTQESNFYDSIKDDDRKIDDDGEQQTSNEAEKEESPKVVINKGHLAKPETFQILSQDRPDLALVIALSILWSVLAFLIMRLKVLWLPTVCVLSGVFVNDCRLYSFFFAKCSNVFSYLPRWFPGFFKVLVSVSFIAFVVEKYWGQIRSEIWPEEMYEFWDPDTVELMEWIKVHSPPDAVFAGSMQLLAGVKLCTGRHITNHPHYEDSWLRKRTHKVYQIYGRESPEVVHEALREAGATYIILEDSICLSKPDPEKPLCTLSDIIDLHNGHIPVNGSRGIPGLKPAANKRFCDVVRHN